MPGGLARDDARVALDRVEIDHVAVGGNPARLMQRNRLFHERRIAPQDEVEKHCAPPLSQRSASRKVSTTATRMMRPRAIIWSDGSIAHQDEAVVEHAHQPGADQRAEDRALAAVQARAADDDGGDDRQEIALAERVARAVQPAGVEKPGEPRQRSADRHDDEAQARHLDARRARGARIVAGGEHVRAEARLRKRVIAERRRGERPPEQRGHAEQRARAEQAVERHRSRSAPTSDRSGGGRRRRTRPSSRA